MLRKVIIGLYKYSLILRCISTVHLTLVPRDALLCFLLKLACFYVSHLNIFYICPTMIQFILAFFKIWCEFRSVLSFCLWCPTVPKPSVEKTIPPSSELLLPIINWVHLCPAISGFSILFHQCMYYSANTTLSWPMKYVWDLTWGIMIAPTLPFLPTAKTLATLTLLMLLILLYHTSHCCF